MQRNNRYTIGIENGWVVIRKEGAKFTGKQIKAMKERGFELDLPHSASRQLSKEDRTITRAMQASLYLEQGAVCEAGILDMYRAGF